MKKDPLQSKTALFEKLKMKGIFWSYAKSITFSDSGDSILCEYTLKYGDFNDLKTLFIIYDESYIKKIWQDKLINDSGLKKLNLFLARIFFKMDIESSYFTGSKNARLEKFRLLAS
jgi:hypothetical protein